MNRESAADAWARFLAGETLSDADERELERILQEDAGLRDELLGEAEIDGWLRVFRGKEGAAEQTVRRFLDRLSAEGDATRFIRIVDSRIGLRPGRISLRRRPLARGFALAAAGLLLGVAAFFAFLAPGPSRPDPRRAASVRPAPEAAPSVEPGTEAARAQREAQERLRQLREEEARAQEARDSAKGEELRRKADEAFQKIARERKEEEERLRRLREAEEAARRDAVPAPPTEPRPAPTTPAPPATRPTVATVERVAGEVYVLDGTRKARAKGGESLHAGQGVETVGAGSLAVLVYPDGTVLEAGADVELAELRAEGGFRVHLKKGELRAVVARQPKDAGMVFAFRDGEAAVLGTTLRIAVDLDPKEGTRVDVEEGRVRVKNLAGRTAEVPSGHFAVAAAGVPLVARRYVNLLVDPGFEKGGRAWQVQSDPAAVAVVGARTRSGSKSLQLSRDPQAKRRVVQDMPVRPGASYDVTVWTWSETPVGAAVTLMWLGPTGSRTGSEVTLTSPRAAQAWVRTIGRQTAPAGAARLRLELLCDVTTGTVWVDDGEVCPAER